MLLYRLKNGLACSLVAGSAGATMGGSIVAGVGAISGSVVGPVGTFFGAAVGSGTGAAVGRMMGCVGGFIGEVLEDPNKRMEE